MKHWIGLLILGVVLALPVMAEASCVVEAATVYALGAAIRDDKCDTNGASKVSLATQIAGENLGASQALSFLRVATVDPCSELAKVTVPFSVAAATTTELVVASALNKVYVCSLVILPVAGAQAIALVEDDTDNCASPSAGMAGGVTAATGGTFAANGGASLGTGDTHWTKTSAINRYVCLMTSTTAQTSGVLNYVLAP